MENRIMIRGLISNDDDQGSGIYIRGGRPMGVFENKNDMELILYAVFFCENLRYGIYDVFGCCHEIVDVTQRPFFDCITRGIRGK